MFTLQGEVGDGEVSESNRDIWGDVGVVELLGRHVYPAAGSAIERDRVYRGALGYK